jgi:hypothetical protein
VSDGLGALKKGLAGLKRLQALPVDLGRVELIRRASAEQLSNPDDLQALLLQLGLNDEGMHEMPAALHPHCGQGLRIWQYPIQFSRYLVALSRLQVRSYLELGVRHGGAFFATVEYLDRFLPLDLAVAVDLLPCPSMDEYRRMNPRASFERLNTQSPELAALAARMGSIDLVFVDSHHEEAQCRRELEILAPRARMIALHDIANRDWPGVRVVWEELKAAGTHQCFEFTEQYGDLGPYMGIGLAVR